MKFSSCNLDKRLGKPNNIITSPHLFAEPTEDVEGRLQVLLVVPLDHVLPHHRLVVGQKQPDGRHAAGHVLAADQGEGLGVDDVLEEGLRLRVLQTDVTRHVLQVGVEVDAGRGVIGEPTNI